MIAITRDVSPALSACELSFVPRTAIDVALAGAQHAAYREALRALGCRVIELPADPVLPDSVFVEDVAVVLDELAVMTRTGAASRRAEGPPIAAALGPFRQQLASIVAPGTLDGGDVLRVGRTLYVGLGARSNAAGIAQLLAHVAPFGYRVQAVPTHGCLHLKSAATCVAHGTVLVQPGWVDASVFGTLDILFVDPAEEHAANTLRIGGGVIHPACFPRTADRLRQAGIRVLPVDLSELQKAEGATTCCSLVFVEIPDGGQA